MSSCVLIYVSFATLFCLSSFVLAKTGFMAWVCGKALTSTLSCEQLGRHWRSLQWSSASKFSFLLVCGCLSQKVLWVPNADVNALQRSGCGRNPTGSSWLLPELMLQVPEEKSEQPKLLLLSPMEQNWASFVPSITFLSPCKGCNIWLAEILWPVGFDATCSALTSPLRWFFLPWVFYALHHFIQLWKSK